MARAVPRRLWLGGVLSPHRDETLIRTLLERVRACACRLVVLVCVDGLARYVPAVRRVFRIPARVHKQGRLRLVLPPTVLLAQVVKQTKKRRVVGVTQRVVISTGKAVAAVLAATHSGRQINTAYIERLTATFRACLVPLTRRGRLVRDVALQAGMVLVGLAYTFCWVHRSCVYASHRPRQLTIAGVPDGHHIADLMPVRGSGTAAGPPEGSIILVAGGAIVSHCGSLTNGLLIRPGHAAGAVPGF
jgi:hypothetical protein